ncbi:MAG: RecQ family ATP-dependent DNA helicase [Mariprofundales bacterium]
MVAHSDRILEQSVFVDLEIHPETQQLLKIGAWRPVDEAAFYRDGKIAIASACSDLRDFIGDSRFIIGHNIAQHDWPWLVDHYPLLKSMQDRLIDTLVLNPLAFPANPYHRLVKDYKLQRESINDPVEDCKQSAVLLVDQCRVFATRPEISAVFSLLLLNSCPSYFALFGLLRDAPVRGRSVQHYIGAILNAGKVCRQARRLVIERIRSNDATSQRAMAYALAWLDNAGSNSVLPAWVRHQHPELGTLLDQLRNQPCHQSDCNYCNSHHNLEVALQQFFGYLAFRQFGHAGSDDTEREPLQRSIVAAVSAATPTLAILPTGGGKSLCYQLPAMMLARNRGLLSIVLSPLQSLMNDQVGQLQQRGYMYAASLNSSLTMPERKRVLDGIRMGDIHLLYIAPEQLRNRSFIAAIESREIGQWIIDEAHCLSKWGHDFRPDYLYIARFVAEFSRHQQQKIPPVHAFTATARLDVIAEIRSHLKKHLGFEMQLLTGGHRRSNLDYRVLRCPAQQKREQILALLEDNRSFVADDAVIIFCNRRRITEEVAAFLHNNGFHADFFHAGRDPQSKRQVQQAFMDGAIQVIAATNAFGMGVDKANVRLVIHAQMPDSLENYLQEAGRAGRDGESARCVLLFDESDADKQFEMRRQQQITFRDFVLLFEAIRKRIRQSGQDDATADMVCASSGDILRTAAGDGDDAPGFDARDWQSDTKVRTAIAWMEEAGHLVRRENRTGVIEGNFKITAMELIRQRLKQQQVSESTITIWLKVAQAIMQHHQDATMNADQLAEQTGMEAAAIFRAIIGLQHAGVMDHDMSLVAWLKAHIAGDSRQALQRLTGLEQQLFTMIREEAGGDSDAAFEINLVHVCHRLREVTGLQGITPPLINQLLTLWSRLDKVVRATPLGRDHHRLKWKQDFASGQIMMHSRQASASVALDYLYDRIPSGEKGQLRIPFKLGAMEDALDNDLITRLMDKEQMSEQALLAMQLTDVLGLENGAAIFHSAMALYIPKGVRKPGVGAFAPLADHYRAQIRQVHLMREWALRMAAGKQTAAKQLLDDYFDLHEKKLLQKHFPHTSREELEIPAGSQRIAAIIGPQALSTRQSDIVQRSTEHNMLILAGPGAGKTRLIVHRVAWLCAIRREAPESVLILAFNRATVGELRARLSVQELLGNSAWRLQIHTYHSLAMHLLGELPPPEEADFQVWSERLMVRAIDHLQQDEADGGLLRQQLLAGLRHILVDEYQDINLAQYCFLSALAGRTLEAQEQQLSMFAVGDDDQNIYEWNGAENRYIHQFQRDYRAETAYLIENYRSCQAIVAVTNRWIAQHPDRLKSAHSIIPVHVEQGSVRLLRGLRPALDVKAVEICCHLIQQAQVPAERIAILCRHHREYASIARRLRSAGLPLCLVGNNAPLRWDRLRQIHAMTRIFEGDGTLSAQQVRARWLELPAAIRNHSCTAPLWQWLASYQGAEAIVRPRREWRAELWELSRSESRKSGKGIWLGTMHSVKGLEFDSVIVFAGQMADQHHRCEELRLRYVAMTRAERNLILMEDAGHWFDALGLEGENLSSEVREEAPTHDIYRCAMHDVHLDFAGQAARPITLASIHEGDSIELQRSSGCLMSNGQTVGKLSSKARAHLQQLSEQGWSVDRVRVHAIVQRYRSDIADDNFMQRCHQDGWEVVLPEIDLRRGGY